MTTRAVAMDFAVDEQDAEVLRLAARLGDSLRRCCRDSEEQGVDEALRREYEQAGLGLLHWPVEAGGAGLPLRLKLLVLEALGHGDAAAALALDRHAWVATPLRALGEQAPADSAFIVDCDAHLEVGDGRASGRFPYLPAARCTRLHVLAGEALHIIDGAGLRLEPVEPGALHALGASRLGIDQAPCRSLALEPQQAAALAAGWRAPVAALLCGLSRAALEYARAYCLERVAFGKPVAHHQAVAFIFSDMAVAVEAARLLLEEAALRGDADAVDRAWLQVAECALFCSNYGLQLVGGAGYMRDHPLEKWMREARALTLLCGGPDAALEAAARAEGA